MKKTTTVTLGALFMLAVSSCSNQPEWTTGYDKSGKAKDTTIRGKSYRYYNGGYYPIYNNMICPGAYSRAYTTSEISSPSFTPHVPSGASSAGHGISTGGFGSSGHSSVGA